MSKDKNIEMKQAYVGNKSHIKCEFGEFIQPLTVTNNKNVTIQGMEIATEKDNVINKNIPYRDGKGAFGICKNGGNCQFKAMEKVKWENVNENVYVGDARTLNGKSFFRCPYVAGQNIEIIEHNQQAIGEFSEKNKNNFWDEAIQMEQQAILMLMKLTMEGKDPLEELRNSFTEQLIKELGYAAEVSAYTLGNDFKDLADSISKVVQNPSLETFSDMSFATNDILSDIGIPGANFFPSGDTFKSLKKLSKNGKKYDVSINGMIDFMNDNIDVTLDEKLKPMSGRKISPEANRWARNTYKQMVLGNGTEEMTLIGTIGEFVNGIIPISGQLADVRDVVFSANKGDGLGVVLSGVGVLPGLDTLKKGPKVIKKIAKKADEAIMAINKALGTNITPKILDSVDEIAAITKKGAKEFTEAMGEWVARNRKALSQLVPNSMIVSKMDEFKAFKQRLICVFTKGNCFVKGTLVKTEYGHKEIEKIEIGERVLSLNTENNKLEYKVVLNTLRSKTIKTILFEFEDNIIVETTPDHKFFVLDKGFVKAENMCENDIVLNNKFKGTRLNKINEIYYFEKNVYNLYVEDNNNYFVTEKGLLVHNKMMSYADIKKWYDEIIEILKKDGFTFKPTVNDFKEAVKSCFSANTKIYMQNSKYIENLRIGDTVYSYNEIKNKVEEKKILNFFEHNVNEILELFFENGEKIETTPEHPFYVDGKYVYAGNLNVGDKVFSENNQNIELVEKRIIFYKKGIKVYNFEVEDNHNYFVGKSKFLVHNDKTLYNINNYKGIMRNGNEIIPKIPNNPKGFSTPDTWFKNHGKSAYIIVDNSNPENWTYGWIKKIEDVDINGKKKIIDYDVMIGKMSDGQIKWEGSLGNEIQILGLTGKTDEDLKKLHKEIAKLEKANKSYYETQGIKPYFGYTQTAVENTFREKRLVGHHVEDKLTRMEGFQITRKEWHNNGYGDKGVRHTGTASEQRKRNGIKPGKSK